MFFSGNMQFTACSVQSVNCHIALEAMFYLLDIDQQPM